MTVSASLFWMTNYLAFITLSHLLWLVHIIALILLIVVGYILFAIFVICKAYTK